LFVGNLQPLTPRDVFDSLVIHEPARKSKIATPAIDGDPHRPTLAAVTADLKIVTPPSANQPIAVAFLIASAERRSRP
jgi:hypothetical protein